MCSGVKKEYYHTMLQKLSTTILLKTRLGLLVFCKNELKYILENSKMKVMAAVAGPYAASLFTGNQPGVKTLKHKNV